MFMKADASSVTHTPLAASLHRYTLSPLSQVSVHVFGTTASDELGLDELGLLDLESRIVHAWKNADRIDPRVSTGLLTGSIASSGLPLARAMNTHAGPAERYR